MAGTFFLSGVLFAGTAAFVFMLIKFSRQMEGWWVLPSACVNLVLALVFAATAFLQLLKPESPKDIRMFLFSMLYFAFGSALLWKKMHEEEK